MSAMAHAPAINARGEWARRGWRGIRPPQGHARDQGYIMPHHALRCLLPDIRRDLLRPRADRGNVRVSRSDPFRQVAGVGGSSLDLCDRGGPLPELLSGVFLDPLTDLRGG